MSAVTSEDTMGAFMGGIVFGGLLMITASVFMDIDFGENYKRGQIDCATGKMSYVLTTQEDSTRTWKEK